MYTSIGLSVEITATKSKETRVVTYMHRLLHEYGYLHYFRDLKNDIIITEGKAQGDYCAITKVSKERRYPYSWRVLAMARGEFCHYGSPSLMAIS